MDPRCQDFCRAVLGAAGAEALERAGARIAGLDAAVLPRVLLSWVESAAAQGHDGDLPGVTNTYVFLAKTEAGLEGTVAVDGWVQDFGAQTPVHVAALLAVGLGIEGFRSDLRPEDLRGLGQAVDTLVKAEARRELLAKKTLAPGHGYRLSHEVVDFGAGDQMSLVRAHDQQGQVVGEAGFSHRGQQLVPETVRVHPEHRRLGLATALYRHAEAQTQKTVVPSSDRTPEGQALWAGSGGQHFGIVKAEDLGKMALVHDDPQKPMTVYRVVGPDGRGPYHSSKRPKELMQAIYRRQTTPTPYEDFEPQEANRVQAHPDYLYGFEAPEHAQAWFGDTVLQRLHERGFRVRAFLARRVYRSTTGKQVAFLPVTHNTREHLSYPEVHLDLHPDAGPPGGWDKAEAPGSTARPVAQQAPLEPEQPQKAPRRIPQLKVSKAEAEQRCGVCGRSQFANRESGLKFRGCLCLAELAKAVVATEYGDGWVLELGPEWDQASAAVLMQALKGH